MKWTSDRTGYGALAIALHWLTLILIIVAYAAMDLREVVEPGTPLRKSMALWHYTAGLSVFALTWLRLFVRRAGTAPVIVPSLPKVQSWLAAAVKIFLYAFMIAMPLLGWLSVNSEGHTVTFFGFALPALAPEDPQRADFFESIHENIATIGYFLIGVHALAALFHHYIKQDNALRMMWFRR
jgi:cytochrome b561